MASRLLTLIMFVLAVVASSAFTALYLKEKGGVSGSVNKDEVSKIVASYIEENPDVIVQGLQKAQMKREMEESKKAEENVSKLRDALENNAKDPQGGNKAGDVTMVAFFDHNCGYCKKSIPDIEKLISEDGKLKFVLKELPILGDFSVQQAKVSLAVAKLNPDQWYGFYVKLSEAHPQNLDQVLAVAQNIGMNVEAIRSEMNSPDIENQINDNRSLADQLGIRGTPAFIIGGKMVKGAVGYDAFKQVINESRS